MELYLYSRTLVHGVLINLKQGQFIIGEMYLTLQTKQHFGQ